MFLLICLPIESTVLINTFISRLYKKLFEKAYGVASSSSVEETVESLQAACSNFNSDQDGIFC